MRTIANTSMRIKKSKMQNKNEKRILEGLAAGLLSGIAIGNKENEIGRL